MAVQHREPETCPRLQSRSDLEGRVFAVKPCSQVDDLCVVPYPNHVIASVEGDAHLRIRKLRAPVHDSISTLIFMRAQLDKWIHGLP